MNDIIAYYDGLADTYDANRFGGSYSEFVHEQEVTILNRALPQSAKAILDVACGTGRLTGYATSGCDASINSVRLAANKWPTKGFVVADLTSMPFAPSSFDAALCFHVFMHLDESTIQAGLRDIARVLRPGGILVADVASGVRRSLSRQRPKGWHGATSFSTKEFSALAATMGLRMSDVSGTILSPIHRVPVVFRRPLAKLDGLMADRFPNLASYIVGRFVKERGSC